MTKHELEGIKAMAERLRYGWLPRPDAAALEVFGLQVLDLLADTLATEEQHDESCTRELVATARLKAAKRAAERAGVPPEHREKPAAAIDWLAERLAQAMDGQEQK